MKFLPAEKDRPRRGPMWPVQQWADENPFQGLLLVGALVAFALAMSALDDVAAVPAHPQLVGRHAATVAE